MAYAMKIHLKKNAAANGLELKLSLIHISLFADVCSIFLILYRKNTIHYTNKKTLNQIISCLVYTSSPIAAPG